MGWCLLLVLVEVALQFHSVSRVCCEFVFVASSLVSCGGGAFCGWLCHARVFAASVACCLFVVRLNGLWWFAGGGAISLRWLRDFQHTLCSQVFDTRGCTCSIAAVVHILLTLFSGVAGVCRVFWATCPPPRTPFPATFSYTCACSFAL